MLALDPALTTAIATVMAAFLAAGGAFLVAARRFSGEITHTSADELWAEARSIREACQKQLVAALLRLANVEKRMAEVERDNAGLTRENIALMRRVDELQALQTGDSG